MGSARPEMSFFELIYILCDNSNAASVIQQPWLCKKVKEIRRRRLAMRDRNSEDDDDHHQKSAVYELLKQFWF